MAGTGQRKRRAAQVIDLCSDNEGDTIEVAAAKRRKIASPKVILTSNVVSHAPNANGNASQRPREILRELTASEFQEKLKVPRAWVASEAVAWRPTTREDDQRTKPRLANPKTNLGRSGSIHDFFTTRASTTASSRAGGSRTVGATKVLKSALAATKHSRAISQSRSAYSLIMQQTSDTSDDELVGAPHTSKRPAPKSKNRSKHRNRDDDDFEPAPDSSSDAQFEDVQPSSDESIYEDEDDGAVYSSTFTKKPVSVKASDQPREKRKASRKNMANLNTIPKGMAKGLDLNLPPIIEARDIFHDIVSKALKQGFADALQYLSGHLKVATMCSGTESPLLALELISDCLGPSRLTIEHLFSAEIVPYKQSYIDRNFSPPVIFRDITELTAVVEDADPTATTAYGGRAPVPRDVDILIAGTSCVDYSKLNNKQKTMDDGGESGDTYSAVLAYCKAFGPSIVVLENVLGADWDRMLADYQAIGYETAGALVDSKLWYLPQTRQRGYMVCFNTHNAAKAMLAGAGQEWVRLMECFRRPASSPASALLLPNDQVVTRRQLKDSEASTESDWSKCELRHTQHRYELRLGNERPITHWSESGTLVVPEIGDSSWYTRQVERVWDLLDIVALRKALPQNGFYDARYKTRIWDVSQNVDRDLDKIAFGISGCITPSGQFFLSDAGRVLSSEELLKMQGFPLNKISFTTETSRQIQDLAGNAMSTPLVGCAIIAALIAGHKAIKPQLPRAASQIPTDPSAFVPAQMKPVELHAPLELDLHDLIDKAQRARRLCVCEGSRGVASAILQQCRDCAHTSCSSCGGNPIHNYAPKSSLSEGRYSPTAFEDHLRNVLPLRLQFSLGNAWRQLDLPPDFRRSVEGLNGQFSLQAVRRTHCWSVTYRGAGGYIALVFAQGHVEWRVFGKPPRDSPANSKIRVQLQQPVAIGIAQNTFLGEKWRIRYPRHVELPADIRMEGSMASWWQRCGLVDFSEHTVPECLRIEVHGAEGKAANLSGTYRHLPQCGSASDSLFKKIDGEGSPLFLFLDPTGIGEPDQDCFVFAENMERMEHDEVRSIAARIAAPWRPWTRPATKSVNPVLMLDDVWHDAGSGDATLTAPEPQIELARLHNLDLLQASSICSQTVHMLRATIPEDEGTREGNIAPSNVEFFGAHNWVLNAMGRCFPKPIWHSCRITAPAHSCGQCAPTRPALRWALQNSNDIKLYEDPAGATLYEQAMKSRPEAIVIRATRRSEQLSIDLGINLATLAHRASARLRVSSGCQYDWRLRQTTDRTPFIFKKFHLASNKADKPHGAEPGLSITLFDQQKRSLRWMIEQETGVDFTMEETEEACVTPLGWMAEVRARSLVRVRGGICADHPGFGKTITSLALVNAQSLSLSKAELLSQLETRKPKGLQATAATLIICPASLQQQWLEEIKEKIGSHSGVISITTAAQLSRHSIESFKQAKIIIVNRTVLNADSYTDRLASFAAIPRPAATTGRAFAQWRSHAMQQIPEHIAYLERNGRSELRKHVSAKYRDNLKSDTFKAFVPSRRHRGQGYVANKAKKPTASKAAAPASIDTTTIGDPFFEMFFFNRLIVDEFHNAEPATFAAIIGLAADKKWGLSGTPAVDDFYQVSQIASLLGVNLPLGGLDRAVMKPGSIHALKADLTSSELFDIGSRQLPSQELYASIWAQHQRFLAVFVRQNVGDFSAISFAERLVPVTLEVEQRLLYTELSQHLNTLQMRIKKGGRSKVTDRSRRLNNAVASSTSAEAALSKAAAFCDQVSKSHSLLDDLITSCGANIESLSNQIIAVADQARGSEPEKFEVWMNRLGEDGLRDKAATQEILELLSRSVALKGARTNGYKEGGEKGEAATSKLHSLCTRLLIERRSLRYLENARMVQKSAQGSTSPRKRCDYPDCAGSWNEVALSSVCGHIICELCFRKLKLEAAAGCRAVGCGSSLHDHHLLWSSRMGDLRRKIPSPYGAKLETVMQLLRQIQAAHEQAILFVQFDNQLEQVQRALQTSGLDGIVVQNAASAGSQLKQFRESAAKDEKPVAIVLNASSETAAGSNLQNANHVIFMSPLLKETQYGYESSMAQAIGRVRRFGQTRPIYVYRVAAIDTIDVDILEHRERRADALLEGQNAPEIEAPAGAKDSGPKAERTQLVRENGKFSLRPRSWLVRSGGDDSTKGATVIGKNRVSGWEDFSSLVKFSSTFTEDDE